jgi:hypothetical protein
MPWLSVSAATNASIRGSVCVGVEQGDAADGDLGGVG